MKSLFFVLEGEQSNYKALLIEEIQNQLNKEEELLNNFFLCREEEILDEKEYTTLKDVAEQFQDTLETTSKFCLYLSIKNESFEKIVFPKLEKNETVLFIGSYVSNFLENQTDMNNIKLIHLLMEVNLRHFQKKYCPSCVFYLSEIKNELLEEKVRLFLGTNDCKVVLLDKKNDLMENVKLVINTIKRLSV